MNLGSRIVLFSFIFWMVFCWQWYTCAIKGFCLIKTFTYKTTQDNYNPPFRFHKSSFLCIKGEDFQSYIDSLKLLVKEGKLVITGFYDSSEINKSTFPNLGLARVQKIKGILSIEIDTSQILSQSKLFDSELPEEPFIAHKIEKEIINTPKMISKNNSILEMAELTDENNNFEFIITFPTHSFIIEHSADLDRYFETVAEKLINSNKKISIVGHTDKVEDKKIGRIRAWVIKKELLKRGVNSNQLITSSKGSLENNTAKNSRVIINLNK